MILRVSHMMGVLKDDYRKAQGYVENILGCVIGKTWFSFPLSIHLGLELLVYTVCMSSALVTMQAALKKNIVSVYTLTQVHFLPFVCPHGQGSLIQKDIHHRMWHCSVTFCCIFRNPICLNLFLDFFFLASSSIFA